MQQVNIMWFRRDLRLHDNAALYHALKSSLPVLPVFIFDTEILDELEDKTDRRVQFIHAAVSEMQEQLAVLGNSLMVYHGKPIQIFEQIIKDFQVEAIFTNHDYEPYAQKRDGEKKKFLAKTSIKFTTYKDQVIFEKNEVVKDNNEPYTVFTPYSKKWKATLTNFYLKAYPTEKYFSNFLKLAPPKNSFVNNIGF